MTRSVLLLALTLCFGLLAAACQPAPAATAVPTPSAPPAPSPTTAPTRAPTLTATPTPLPSPTFRLEPSATPVPIPTAQACIPGDTMPVGFMPGGEALVVSGPAGASLIDLQAGAVVGVAEVAGGSSGPAALSPDGALLAWPLPDNSVQLIRMTDGRAAATLTGHTGVIAGMAFSPDGQRLYTASADSWVRVWDTASGRELDSFQPGAAGNQPGEIVGLGLSPDGTLLATAPFDGPVRVWDAATFEPVIELGGTGGFSWLSAVFSPDNHYLAANLATGLYIWDVTTGDELEGGNWGLDGISPGINSAAAAYSPDGSLLAYSRIGESYDIVLAEPDGTGARVLGAMAGPAWRLFFSPDGTRLVTTYGEAAQIWRVADGALLVEIRAACPAANGAGG